MSWTAGGVSREARFVEAQMAGSRRNLQHSVFFGQTAVEDALYSVAEECREPNWDGYGAEPVSEVTCLLACRFLETLPLGCAAPTVGAEPDGQITFEWHRSARYTLSVSVDPEARLHYSALLGASKARGEEPFFGEMPERIGEIIGCLERS